MGALKNLDALILAVSRDSFKKLEATIIRSMFAEAPVVLLDVKGAWNKQDMLAAGCTFWRL